jgi:hypothetical protein
LNTHRSRVLGTLDLRWLSFLAAGDLIVIAAHFLRSHLAPDDAFLLLGRDRGLAEVYRCVKMLAAAGLLTWACAARRDRLMLLWAALILYVALDDWMRIHESIGIWLTDNTPSMQSVSEDTGHALGELLWLSCIALTCAGVAAWMIGQGDASWQPSSTALAGWLGVLALFAVGVDFANSIAQQCGTNALAIPESAGELIAMSLVTACAAAVSARAV